MLENVMCMLFADHLYSDKHTNFVVDCIHRLHVSGITVCAVTGSVTEVNLDVFRNLSVTVDETFF